MFHIVCVSPLQYSEGTIFSQDRSRTKAGNVKIVNLCSSKGNLSYCWGLHLAGTWFSFFFSIFGLYFLFSYADLGAVSVCFSVSHTLFVPLFWLWDERHVSCRPGCSWTFCLARIGLELWLLPPKCWFHRCVPLWMASVIWNTFFVVLNDLVYIVGGFWGGEGLSHLHFCGEAQASGGQQTWTDHWVCFPGALSGFRAQTSR